MNRLPIFIGSLGVAMFWAGCATPIPPGAERGPNGTMAYNVLIETSSPAAKIEANGELLGEAPLHLKIFGDPDGTFHDFGSPYYEVRALPVATNQFLQTRLFRTGQMLSGEDRIPQRIYFDMSQPPPSYLPAPFYGYPPVYGYPPAFYGGPSISFGFGSDYYYGHSHYHGPFIGPPLPPFFPGHHHNHHR
ncbi:MAG: hypothetical protein ACR2H1_02870 [Limisphaerales bacterium]